MNLPWSLGCDVGKYFLLIKENNFEGAVVEAEVDGDGDGEGEGRGRGEVKVKGDAVEPGTEALVEEDETEEGFNFGLTVVPV